MDIPTKRQSAFELLRIIALVLITSCHFASHGVWPDQGSSILSDMALAFLTIWGEIGVNCFIMMSGYFMYSSTFKIKSLLKLILETVFYSYIIQLLFVGLSIGEEPLRYLVRSLLPISGGNYWFMTAYVAMYMTSPIVVWCEKRFKRETYSKVLLILMLLLSAVSTVTTRTFVYSSYPWFIFVFMLGGFLRKYPDGISNKTGKYLAVACLCFIMCSEVAILLLARVVPFVSVRHAVYFTSANSLPEIGLSLGIVLFVKAHPISHNKVINVLAKPALAVYLITDNPYVREWLWPHFTSCYEKGWFVILCAGLFAGCLLYFLCSCIDLVRLLTFEKWAVSIVERNNKLSAAIETIDSFMLFD